MAFKKILRACALAVGGASHHARYIKRWDLLQVVSAHFQQKFKKFKKFKKNCFLQPHIVCYDLNVWPQGMPTVRRTGNIAWDNPKGLRNVPVPCEHPDGQHWVNHPDVRLRNLRAILTLRRYLSTLEYLPRYYHPSGRSYRIGSASLDITAPA